MTALIENKLYCVEVPSDATYWVEIDHDLSYYFNYNFDNDQDGTSIKLECDFKIIGEVTKDEISSGLKEFVKYRSEYEFRILLQSKGIYFENPIKKPKQEISNPKWSEDEFSEWAIDWHEFKESENKVIKGKLIILEKL